YLRLCYSELICLLLLSIKDHGKNIMPTDDKDETDKGNSATELDAAPSGEGDLFFEESEELSPETRAQF
ncbi:MAG: hypothetical protein WCB68_17075, partial [Pyrinomonadaceae bacterium]